MLGRRTAELHRAFASDDRDPHFKPEPIKAADITGWVSGARKLANAAYSQLTKALPSAPDAVRGAIEGLLERKDECLAAIDALGKGAISASKTRIHGDSSSSSSDRVPKTRSARSRYGRSSSALHPGPHSS